MSTVERLWDYVIWAGMWTLFLILFSAVIWALVVSASGADDSH